MKWIDSGDRLPKHGISVLVENRSGQYYKQEYNGCVPKDWWERNILRWLDESIEEAVFTIEDMKKAYQAGVDDEYENTGSFDDFMKYEYNIDIN
jgi:hypothetical protein